VGRYEKDSARTVWEQKVVKTLIMLVNLNGLGIDHRCGGAVLNVSTLGTVMSSSATKGAGRV
jgi:hypothetical protein